MRGLWRLRQILGGPATALRRLRERRAQARALRAVADFPRIGQRAPHGLPTPLVVSLTSYPPRFPSLHLTLRSLLDQTTGADRTVLWVTPEDLALLPREVLDLRARGLAIETCRNLRSYKKLVPALRAHPEATIVTADDDVYYPPTWLSRLVAAHRAHPGEVVGVRCHLARIEADGALQPYGRWGFETSATAAPGPRERLFPTGIGGILYPPGALDPRVTDEERFMALCPSTDDVWFFWMARLAGTRHRRVPGRLDLVNWPGSQEAGLFWANMVRTGNDDAIRTMEAEFGPAP